MTAKERLQLAKKSGELAANYWIKGTDSGPVIITGRIPVGAVRDACLEQGLQDLSPEEFEAFYDAYDMALREAGGVFAS